jgi:4-hydroxybenzoate polyprenyltransferase
LNIIASLQPYWSAIISRFRGRFPELSEKIPALVELTRLNRPIGIFLLLWPTISALWIAAEGVPSLSLLFIFLSGTAIMRSAGCCVNDFADYKIDGQVSRTQQRPLARGALRRQDAFYCFGILSSIGFILVLFTNRETILLSFGAVSLVAIYPFMKRYTNLPQLVLGVAFSWGILMAFTAQTGAIPQAAYLLFVGNVLWTVAYDTEYAMVDREFDIEIGVKSTAILFGDMDKAIIAMLQMMFIVSMWLAGRQLEMGIPYYASLVIACGLLGYQQYLIRNRLPSPCFSAFLNNNWVGAIIFTGIFLNYI